MLISIHKWTKSPHKFQMRTSNSGNDSHPLQDQFWFFRYLWNDTCPIIFIESREWRQKETYSVIRTEKLVFPPATSYQPISCRINDSKYFVRMRVICRIAVRLKQSTQNIPNMNCHNVAINDKMPYAIESLMISLRFTSIDSFVLQMHEYFRFINWNW